MPVKLIVFLISMSIFVIFTGLNVNNKADISFGFAVIKNVPIFITIFFAFLMGVLAVSPFFLTQKFKIRKKLYDQAEQEMQEIEADKAVQEAGSEGKETKKKGKSRKEKKTEEIENTKIESINEKK